MNEFYSIYKFNVEIINKINKDSIIINSTDSIESITKEINDKLDILEDDFKAINNIINIYYKCDDFTLKSYGNNGYFEMKYFPFFDKEVNNLSNIQNEYFRLKKQSKLLTIQDYINDFKPLFEKLSKLSNDYYDIKDRFITVINTVCETNPFRKKIPLNKITQRNPYGLECDKDGYPYKIDGCSSTHMS